MKWRCKVNNSKLIQDIKQNFMLKRIKAQEECDNFILNLRKQPEFDNLYSELLKKQVAYFKSQIEEVLETKDLSKLLEFLPTIL